MKKQVRVGYQTNFKYVLGTGARNTYTESTCITRKVIHRQRFPNMWLLQHQIFHGQRTFQHVYHITTFKSFNIVLEVGNYQS